MNRDDRRLLRSIIQDLQSKISALEDLSVDLEGRSLCLEEHFPNKADLITTESELVCDSISYLEDAIGNLEELSPAVMA